MYLRSIISNNPSFLKVHLDWNATVFEVSKLSFQIFNVIWEVLLQFNVLLYILFPSTVELEHWLVEYGIYIYMYIPP